MTVKIVQKEDPVLREVAREVGEDEIGSDRIGKIIKNMKEALDSQDDGVAIAAPQIGESLRIFIMSRKVYEMMDSEEEKLSDVQFTNNNKYRDVVFINPIITKLSREKVEEDEGCLSVRWLYGRVKRAKKATIEALGEDGKKFKMGASGLIAQIFQHECDHLDGVLFTDKAADLEEMPPQA